MSDEPITTTPPEPDDEIIEVDGRTFRVPAAFARTLREAIVAHPLLQLGVTVARPGGPKRPEYEPLTGAAKLAYLVEECGEVLAAAGKALRWGLHSTNPELPEAERETNAEWLSRELDDLEAAIARVRTILPRSAGTR